MIHIDQTECLGCGDCVEVCPREAIRLVGSSAKIDRARCDNCGLCLDVCPSGAIQRAQLVIPPRPTAALAAPKPSQRASLLSAAGAALAYLGMELLPRVLPLALDMLEERVSRDSREHLRYPRDGLSRADVPVGRRLRRGRGQGHAGMCQCPRCGYRVRHPAGTPCRTMACPQCGSRLIRQ